jgi:hypothetical protein
MSDTPHLPQHNLSTWVKANIVATIALTIAIIGSSGGLVWTISRWIATFENQISLNKDDVFRATHDVSVLKDNVVSLDARVNELKAHVAELNSMGQAADAELRSRLNVIDALAKFTADRALQPNLPAPYQPQQGQRR